MSVKIAVVGLGVGAMHLRNLASIPDASVVAVADLDPALLAGAADSYGARPYSGWKELLEGERELDALILATPAMVRRDPIAAVCERGIALFCEKPPAMTRESAGEIRAMIERAGILNTVGLMYRWDPLANRMRQLLEGHHRLLARSVVAWPVFEWVANGWASKWLYRKDGCGGPLIEQAIHFQDVLRYITGDEPVKVQAIADLGSLVAVPGRDCEETTGYLLQHESGMVSTHLHNWSHKKHLLEIQVVGEDINLTWQIEKARLFGTVGEAEIDESAKANPYLEELKGFVNAVQCGDQGLLRSSYADATQSLEVCIAATESLASGKSVDIGAFERSM
jgi:myo-inositol 2-dehydrogenase/D-chiro-inositol 1-dehydrogenase